MNVEREYYENDNFWRNEALGERDSERVKMLVEQIPDSVTSVVELGCGNGIFVNSLDRGVREFERIVGLDRSVSALKYVRVAKICASIDRTPLRDGAFDCVAALEVLEHLPNEIYNAALKEMCRLGRRFALVSVPYRQNLKEGLVECPSCSIQFNPDYHVRSYDEQTLETLLKPFGFACLSTVKIAPFLQYRGIAAFRGFTRRPVASTNPFTTPIPCPACGHYLPAADRKRSAGNAAGSAAKGIKPLLKKYWPRGQSHVWIAALYERAS